MRRFLSSVAIIRPVLSLVILACIPSWAAQDLLPGHIEVRGLGGMNYDPTERFVATLPGIDLTSALKTEHAQPAYAFEVAIGLTQWAALVGSYGHNQRPDRALPVCLLTFDPLFATSTSCSIWRADRRMHEFMGGFRASVPTGTRFTPYAQFGAGAIRETTEAIPLPSSPLPSTAFNRFAVAPGAGVNVMLTRHLGLTLDARGVKAIGFEWFFRTTGGIFWRF